MKRFASIPLLGTKRAVNQTLKGPLAPRKRKRAKPNKWLDALFWHFAKAGATPGIFFLFPLLLTSVFLSIGLIYHYGQLGTWISTGLSLGVLIFAYTLRYLVLNKDSFRIRQLGYVYLGTCLALITTTVALNVWGF